MEAETESERETRAQWTMALLFETFVPAPEMDGRRGRSHLDPAAERHLEAGSYALDEALDYLTRRLGRNRIVWMLG